MPILSLLLSLTGPACQGDTGSTVDSNVPPVDSEAVPDAAPAPDFERYCTGEDWTETAELVTLGDGHGRSLGAYQGLSAGTAEAMSYVPDHPLHVTALRLHFYADTGTARIRLMSDYGRSYADITGDDADLMPPIDLEVTDEMTGDWVEVDVRDQEVFLHPAEPVYLVYEHLEETPLLTVEELPSDEHTRAALWLDGSWYGVGDDNGSYNFRMELVGEQFCDWDTQDRWFSKVEDPPWGELSSSRATIADVDGDGWDDIVLNSGGPVLYLNGGDGTFGEVADDPWPDAAGMAIMIFADLDQDSDVDAVGLTWEGGDGDGDGHDGGVDGTDCNDADAAVSPDAEETDNGLDDNCDGEIDGGGDDSDADLDGHTTAEGDCDDTRDDVYPDAPELNDGRDNDCDLVSDEDFVNRVLLNDGTGRFQAIDCPGLATSDPTGGGAFGDADGDGVLDVYWGNWLRQYPNPPAVPDRFLFGDGSGCFEPPPDDLGLTTTTDSGSLASYGVVWVDYNNDGHQDIFVSNYGYGLNRLFENLGDGTFDEVGSAKGVSHDSTGSMSESSYGGNTFGADWGDVDNDGDMDLVATNIAHPRYQPWSDISQLLESSGAPDFTFTDVREDRGVHYDEGDVNASFVDWDNDGDLDLMVSSLYTGHYSRLYRNDGDTYTDVTYESGTQVHDAVSNVWLDADGDGDMDLVLADRQGAPYVHLFLNQADTGNHWLELFLEGTTSNHSAVGARVSVVSDGVTRIREVKGGGGHSGNQSTLMVHFGLGLSETVDELTVTWPGGETESFSGASADARYRLVEGAGVVADGP